MQIGKWKLTVKDAVWFIVCLAMALCFVVGLIIFDKDSASSVLSGASTAISIVLSIVAILYTMIEGANSSRINQDSQNKLNDIESQLKEVNQKLYEVKRLDKRVKDLIPQLSAAAEKIEQMDENILDDRIKKELQYLENYFDEDLDE